MLYSIANIININHIYLIELIISFYLINMESSVQKLISLQQKDNVDLKNFQIKFFNKSKDSQINEYFESISNSNVILNLSSLNKEDIVDVIKTNENLRIDFFKFELYRINFFKDEAIMEILKKVSCNSDYLENVVEFCLEKNSPQFIYNLILCNSENLFENQLCMIIRLIINDNSKPTNNSELYCEELSNNKDNLSSYYNFLDLHDLKSSRKSFNLFLFYTLLITKPGVFDKNLLFNSLLIELSLSKIDQTEKMEERNLKCLMDFYFILLNLSVLCENSLSCIFYICIFLDIIIYLHRIGKIDNEVVQMIWDLLYNSKIINSSTNKLFQEDYYINSINSFLNSFGSVSKSIDIMKTNFTNLNDKIEIDN